MALKDWKKEVLEYDGDREEIIFENIKANKGIKIDRDGKNVTLTYFPRIGQGHTSKRKVDGMKRAYKLAKSYMRKH